MPEPGAPLFIAADEFLFDLPWPALSCAGLELGEHWRLASMPSAALATVEFPDCQSLDPPLVMGFPGTPQLK